MLAECVRVLTPGGYLLVEENEWAVSLGDDDEDEVTEVYPTMCRCVSSKFRQLTSSSDLLTTS